MNSFTRSTLTQHSSERLYHADRTLSRKPKTGRGDLLESAALEEGDIHALLQDVYSAEWYPSPSTLRASSTVYSTKPGEPETGASAFLAGYLGRISNRRIRSSARSGKAQPGPDAMEYGAIMPTQRRGKNRAASDQENEAQMIRTRYFIRLCQIL